MRIKPEPTFLGVYCNGPNIEKSDALLETANGTKLLSDFYRMDREDQLVLAAMTEQMVANNQ